jgi:hypothetical protein
MFPSEEVANAQYALRWLLMLEEATEEEYR